MPAMTTEVDKAQPWRAHWSPNTKKASGTIGYQYFISTSGDVIVDGMKTQDHFFELACSKAQPWRAHWSSNTKSASGTAGYEYLTSSTGNVIVDGLQGGSKDHFSELARSKAQPWKAHWSPNTKSASDTVRDEDLTLTTTTGDVIIDGTMVDLSIGFTIQGGSPTRFSELACSAKEPPTSAQIPKAQPWKAHWPPKKDASDTASAEYLTSSTGEAIVDGVDLQIAISVGIFQGGSSTRLTELACSAKQPSAATEVAKAQPWKAHWPPKKDASDTASGEYLTSSTGEAIVDGFVIVIGVGGFQGGSSTRLTELACSDKKPSTTAENPKAQPWKAHWSPNENASRKADNQYAVSSAGEPIVDGDGSGGVDQYIASSNGNVIVDGIQVGPPSLFSELACSSKEETK